MILVMAPIRQSKVVTFDCTTAINNAGQIIVLPRRSFAPRLNIGMHSRFIGHGQSDRQNHGTQSKVSNLEALRLNNCRQNTKISEEPIWRFIISLRGVSDAQCVRITRIISSEQIVGWTLVA